MADTPLSRIEQILIDTGPYSAEYRPTPIVEKPAYGCDLPPKILSTLKLPVLPVVKDNLDCNLNFIPTPIVVPPFIPPFDNLNCPDGYAFDAQYDSAPGECVTQQPPSDGLVALLLEAPATVDHFDLNDEVLPDMYAYIPQPVASTDVTFGVNQFTIVTGAVYKVVFPAYDSTTQADKGIAYFAKDGTAQTFKHNQTFVGISGTGHGIAETSESTINSLVVLYEVQHQRIIKYDKVSPFRNLYVNSPGFVRLPSDKRICKFELRRLVFSTDPLKDTAGIIDFAQKPCGGHLFGEININVADVSVPCATSIGEASFIQGSDSDKITVNDYLTADTDTTPAAVNTGSIKVKRSSNTHDGATCSYTLGLDPTTLNIPDIAILINGHKLDKTVTATKVTFTGDSTGLEIGGGSGGGCAGCCRWS